MNQKDIVRAGQIADAIAIHSILPIAGDASIVDINKNVFDEFEPIDDIQKSAKANIGETRIWSGKKMRKESNGKWVEVSEHGMSKKEHKERYNIASEAKNAEEAIERKKHYDAANQLDEKEYDERELSKATSEEKKAKIAKVMGEFKAGTLKTSAGDVVTDRNQALAIAFSYFKSEDDDIQKAVKHVEDVMASNKE
jgi:hypothetical protein